MQDLHESYQRPNTATTCSPPPRSKSHTATPALAMPATAVERKRLVERSGVDRLADITDQLVPATEVTQ